MSWLRGFRIVVFCAELVNMVQGPHRAMLWQPSVRDPCTSFRRTCVPRFYLTHFSGVSHC
eukprot:11002640-Alexandrium_andersonii.AAC.1